MFSFSVEAVHVVKHDRRCCFLHRHVAMIIIVIINQLYIDLLFCFELI